MKQHYDMDTLLAYLESPSAAEYSNLRLHLSGCNQCRASVGQLNQLQSSIKQSPEITGSNGELENQLTTTVEEQLIEKYVDGALAGSAHQQIKSLLQQQPQALKAALHYAGHRAAMDRAGIDNSYVSQAVPLNNVVSQQSKHRSEQQTLINKLAKFFELRPPIWLSVPATAMAMLAIIVLVYPSASPTGDNMAIASYQDNAVIRFQDINQPPGIGFFSKAQRTSKPYEAMQVTLTKDSLNLQWPVVDKATSYNVIVYIINEGQRLTISEQSSNSNNVAINNFNAQIGKRYEWQLTGETSDAKTFTASGGFVINQQ